mgnify:CR=1 FL=1
MEDVTLAAAQQGLHTRPEGLQPVVGDEGLDGAGKASAMDPDGSSALQQFLTGGQGQRDGLLTRI